MYQRDSGGHIVIKRIAGSGSLQVLDVSNNVLWASDWNPYTASETQVGDYLGSPLYGRTWAALGSGTVDLTGLASADIDQVIRSEFKHATGGTHTVESLAVDTNQATARVTTPASGDFTLWYTKT